MTRGSFFGGPEIEEFPEHILTTSPKPVTTPKPIVIDPLMQVIIFIVFIQNRLISGGLELVSHPYITHLAI